MKMPTTAALVLLLLAGASLMADWKLYADKKPNQITGKKNVEVQVGAKGLSTSILVLGCSHDGKQILRIADRFRSFRMEAGVVPVKLRHSNSAEFFDLQAPVTRALKDGATMLILDAELGRLLPKMKTDPFLLAQLPYDTENKVVQLKPRWRNSPNRAAISEGFQPSGR